MDYFIKKTIYQPDKTFLKTFIDKFWFIPSDVLLRSIEANIWNLCHFKKPILDIGIGNGETSSLIFRKFAPMDIGIDINKDGLEEAKKFKIYKKILYVNAESMPFKTNSFNTVISNSTFEHILNDKKALAESARVLKKNGILFLTVPSKFLPTYIPDDKLSSFNVRTQHYHYRSIEEWKTEFKKNKLKLIYYSYYLAPQSALKWYRIFSFFTKKINNKELWSYIGFSKLKIFLPKKIIIYLEEKFLEDLFMNSFLTKNSPGGMLFMIAEKE